MIAGKEKLDLYRLLLTLNPLWCALISEMRIVSCIVSLVHKECISTVLGQ